MSLSSISLVNNSISHVNHSLVPQLYGIRAQGERVQVNDYGVQIIQSKIPTVLILFGFMVEALNVTLTKKKANYSDDCTDFWHSGAVLSKPVSKGIAEIDLDLSEPGEYFICFQQNIIDIQNKTKVHKQWLHQGSNSHVTLRVEDRLMPVPVQIALIFLCLALSGTFSGLNLGLMSLDLNEIQVIIRCGTELEKRYAKIIAPIRKKGNYLLCSILFGNVLVNSTLTILMDDLTSGLVAIIVSTLSIVVFGEIVPQAICSRHGLAVGAKTIYLTKLFMLLTFPLSIIISKFLDYVLGEEIGHVYDRERLMEYIRVTKTYNKLEEDEMNIISGALGLKTKTAADVMTRLEDAFMLPITSILDFNTLSEISKKGYSRIPVYDTERKNVTGLLHTKDLTFVDPDDKKPLRTLIEFYRHPLVHTDANERLNNVLNHFKLGKSHLAFVTQIYDSGEEDPYYEIIGLVTLEDVIEEILQMEIVDETDILTDNRKKQKRKDTQFRQDFSDFAKIGEGEMGTQAISPQMALATFQYLSTAIEPFQKKFITENILRRLIAQKIYYCSEANDCEELTFLTNTKEEDEENYLYRHGKAADYFILILEGKVKVIVGNENLTYESGPFTYFGVSALKPPALATKMLLGGNSLGNNSNSALNNLTNSLNQQTSNSRPPSPESIPLIDNAGPLTSSSRPGSPEIMSLMRSPSGNSDMLFARTSSSSQLLQQPFDSNSFIPDFTVKPIENTLYMKIHRKVYLAAFRASLMDRKDEFLESDFALFKEEVDNIIYTRLANNKAIGNNNQAQQNKMKKTSTDVLREKKFSIAGISPKYLPSESMNSSNLISSQMTKRRSSIIDKQYPPQSPKAVKKFTKHQSITSSSSNTQANLPSSNMNNIASISANNNNFNIVNNNLSNNSTTNITTNPQSAQLENVVVQDISKESKQIKY